MKENSVSVLIAAAGCGSRMKSAVPKQFLTVANIPILALTLIVFEQNRDIDEIVVVTRASDISLVTELAKEYKISKLTHIIEGGKTRQESVTNGLKAVSGEYVLIHDGARPFVTDIQISEVISAARNFGAAALGIPVTDTLKYAEDDFVCSTHDRSKLYSIQTPQAFKTREILKAHETALKNNIAVTDDCSVFEAIGRKIKIVSGSSLNIKITTPEDLILAEAIINKTEAYKMRIGMGYDVHKLVKDRKLILGGVEVPYELGLLGHSDADVLLHAISDAMLGAMSLGDIGKHFPDTDDKWKGADSRKLLIAVNELLQKKGAAVSNIDATVIAQKPKLAEYIPLMIKNISEDLNIPEDSISIKATTTEKLGFCGRSEGIAAEAVCCVECRHVL